LKCVVTWSEIGTQRIVFSSLVCQDVPTCNLDTTLGWFSCVQQQARFCYFKRCHNQLFSWPHMVCFL